MESLIKSGFARKHPISMLLDAILLCSVGIFVGLSTFPNYTSILNIAFVTVGIMPVLYSVFVKEEKEEAKKPGAALTFLGRHFDIIMVYSWFFIGLIVAYAFWYHYLPEPQRALAFKEQEATWGQINQLRGNLTQTTSIATACQSRDVTLLAMNCIYYNNAIVLGWAILFSFVYGAGSIFLIAWNASVIGLVIGKEWVSTNVVRAMARAIGLLPHGMPEIFAYFFGAIAGGIISVGVTKKKYRGKEFEIVLKDAAVMIITAYIVLFAAAVIEAYLIIGG